jgi:hypothetical protein
LQYIENPESKFEGDIGALERRHIQADGLVHKGKEANNIEDQPLDVKGAQVSTNEEKIKNRVPFPGATSE